MSIENEIGARLRQRRETLGVSLRSVAHAVGVSPSLISQVETGKTQPSVATLYSLANFLSISVDELLGIANDEPVQSALPSQSLNIQRGVDNPLIEMENGVRWERLAMGAGGPADALLVTYQPGASSSLEGKLMRHAGVEYAYMLEGTMTLQVEFDSYEVSRGDSLHFDSSRPHMFANHGPVPATGIWFVVGRRDAGGSRRVSNAAMPRTQARSAVDILQRLDGLDDDAS
ncbi:cupin domain-containing protein [Microbacterium sp. NPDC076911]|uniref:cupin domain-containing protein n=1 Tax=Microbacterium sp. NPDC076911 TaxID=3154958 RepID=UPI0034474200